MARPCPSHAPTPDDPRAGARCLTWALGLVALEVGIIIVYLSL